jgi:hypothetical protein
VKKYETSNLDADGSRPGLIARVVAELVEPALMPAKLAPIPDDDPAIAAEIRTLLDQLVAGADIRPQVILDLAAIITPTMNRRVQQILAPVWPEGTLTLSSASPFLTRRAQIESTLRISKGSDSMLIRYGRNAQGKIAVLGFHPIALGIAEDPTYVPGDTSCCSSAQRETRTGSADITERCLRHRLRL